MCIFKNGIFRNVKTGFYAGLRKKERRPRTERRRKERKSMFFLMIGFIKWNVRGFETQCHSECGHAWGDKHGPNAHDGGCMGRTASERPKSQQHNGQKRQNALCRPLGARLRGALTTTAFGSAASGAAAAETALSASSVSTEVPVRLCRAVLSILSAISLPSARATASSARRQPV